MFNLIKEGEELKLFPTLLAAFNNQATPLLYILKTIIN